MSNTSEIKTVNGASVKIMLSYDYCHFEVALSLSGDETQGEQFHLKAVNELRKQAQRLADEAVRQYKHAKMMAKSRSSAGTGLEFEVERIKRIPETERTSEQVAIMKSWEDGTWAEQFDYNYEDDELPF